LSVPIVSVPAVTVSRFSFAHVSGVGAGVAKAAWLAGGLAGPIVGARLAAPGPHAARTTATIPSVGRRRRAMGFPPLVGGV
jgi:hypothetical protein